MSNYNLIFKSSFQFFFLRFAFIQHQSQENKKWVSSYSSNFTGWANLLHFLGNYNRLLVIFTGAGLMNVSF